MTLITRRLVLAAAPAAAAFPAPAVARGWSKGAFTHAVASGDPLARSVILWTRFVPAAGANGEIGWEIAEDEGFKRVARRGRVMATASTDFCVKVEATRLKPGRPYFYRFLGGEGPSVTGRTRTAPQGGIDAMTLALFSCSNLPFGYFNAYAHAAAREDVDLCVHVGDYIYEYARGTYPDAKAALPDRVIEPAGEIITWNDYHQRYASYRADPDLQELHRVKPWVSVWDDHEITNDAWMDGAQNHDLSEGAWVDRLAAAGQAYFDWMPIRGTRAAPWKLYRSLDWGDLASIALLDTRRIGRMKQLDYRAVLAPVAAEGPAAVAKALQTFAQAELNAPGRTLLGAEQEAFLEAELKRSKARGATWSVIAQQLVTGPQRAPAQLAGMLADDAPAFVKQFAAVGAQLGQFGLEWNLDSWGGYPAARQRLLQACANHAPNALVLSGDSHNAWAYNLPGGKDGRPAAVEAAGTSVTSPGFESTFTKTEMGGREAAMRSINPDLAWCDLTHKGYAAIRLTRTEAQADYVLWSHMREKGAAPVKTVRLTAEATADKGVSGWAVSS